MERQTPGRRHRARLFTTLSILTSAIVLGVAGCGSSGGATATVATGPAHSAAPSTSATPGGSVAPSAPGTPSTSGKPSVPGVRTVTLDEKANGSTVKVGVGDTVVVELHSTSWSAVASSASTALGQSGKPVTLAPTASASPSCRPLPGSGCGTVATTFVAHAAGSAQLTASRTQCGEARACPSDQRSFAVTVQIVPAG